MDVDAQFTEEVKAPGETTRMIASLVMRQGGYDWDGSIQFVRLACVCNHCWAVETFTIPRGWPQFSGEKGTRGRARSAGWTIDNDTPAEALCLECTERHGEDR